MSALAEITGQTSLAQFKIPIDDQHHEQLADGDLPVGIEHTDFTKSYRLSKLSISFCRSWGRKDTDYPPTAAPMRTRNPTSGRVLI